MLTMSVMKGFNSTAPEYKTPMTVVRASMEPNKIIKKLGNTSDFNVYMKPSPSSQNIVCAQGLRTKLLKSIYSKLKTAKKLF